MANPYHESLMRRLGLIDDLDQPSTQVASSMAQRRRAAAEQARSAPLMAGGYGGSNSNGNQSNLLAFGRQAQKLGYRVGENPNFGSGRVGKHVAGSKHYKGNAVDINWSAGTSRKEQNMLRKLLPLAERYGLRSIFMQPGHYGHAHFDTGRR